MPSVGFKATGRKCTAAACPGGRLRDQVLDWWGPGNHGDQGLVTTGDLREPGTGDERGSTGTRDLGLASRRASSHPSSAVTPHARRPRAPAPPRPEKNPVDRDDAKPQTLNPQSQIQNLEVKLLNPAS
jgi:hypothetical protein